MYYFHGREDIDRQKLNVFRMELLGAKVVSVSQGSGTFKDAVNEALRYWVANVEDTHYIMGSVARTTSIPGHSSRFSKCHWERNEKTISRRRRAFPDAHCGLYRWW